MAGIQAVSRRALGRLIGTGVAAAALRPLFAVEVPLQRGTVRLSANENPYGPSPAALVAMRDACQLGWRYPDEAVGVLIADLSTLRGLRREWFVLVDGSGE